MPRLRRKSPKTACVFVSVFSMGVPVKLMNDAFGKASRRVGYAMPAALISLAAAINSRFADGKNL